MSDITLSRIHPDQAQIRAQLQLALASLDSWKDLLPTATGQAVVDFVAAVGDMDQYAIEHSYKEAFLDGQLDSSIYAIARLLGVRLTRKTPAAVSVTFTRDTALTTVTVPAYTEFAAGGVSLFNRDPFVMNIGVLSKTVTLYEGQVRTVNTMSDGSNFQSFIAPDKAFTVSDVDVEVTAAGQRIAVIRDGLWDARNTKAAQDLTFSQGEFVLLFGNAEFGYRAPVNTTLTIRYVVTTGASGNNGSFTGQAVTASATDVIKGLTVSALVGGADEAPATFYRRFGPRLFSATNRANTEDEYQAVAVGFPSVVDALVRGERKLSTSDFRYMNLVRVSLLTNSIWGTPQQEAFSRYYEERTMFPVRFYFAPASALVVNVAASVSCSLQGDLTAIEIAVREKLRLLFEPRAGIIGLNFYKSDVYEAIRLADPGISYVELLAPTSDVYPMFNSPTAPTVTELLGVGPLGPQTVAYAVSVVTPDGETLATNVGSQVLTGLASAVRIEWTPVPGALGYKIYGRTFPGARLLASLGPDVSQFTDVGFPLGVAEPPVIDTSGIRYCQLGTVTLTMQYTNRRLA